MQSNVELDLAELLRERQDLAGAERGYGHALALLGPADDRRRLQAHRGRGAVLYRQGRTAEAVADFEAARALAQTLGDAEAEVELLLDHAIALDWANDAPAAAALVSQAESLAQNSGVRARHLAAALLVGRGRTLFRAGRWAECAGVLEQATSQAELLGTAGYESLVIALLLLEVVLPNLGRLDDAAQVSERVLALTRAKGDRLNLASALNNRRNILVARGDLQAALEDQREFMEVGRALGVSLSEYAAEYNMAELLYQSGDIEAAEPHAQRAVALEVQNPVMAARPLAALLHARLLTFKGLVAEARLLLEGIQSALAEARAQGRANALFVPSEEVLAAMVDLATREASQEEWDALLARSQTDSLEQEPIEVMEMRARYELRQGRGETARRFFEAALALATGIPNLMTGRLLLGQQAVQPS